MWYSTRQEGFDDPRPSLRGPCVDLPGFLCCGASGNSYFLRGGSLLQVLSLSGLFVSYWTFGGSGLFGYELEGLSEEARSSHAFQVAMAVWSGLYMIGASYLVCFQAILADDACWARGYRAGSKILRLATFLDLLSSIMQFIFYLYIAKFYSAKWYAHFLEGGSERIFFSYIRCMHSLALLLYACAYYLLEVYHDEGAGDLHAYINASLFALAGIVEFSVLFSGMSGVATMFIWLALVAVTTWAFFFEPEVNEVSPSLHETELTNDVEQQVEKFARMSPYYPTGDGSAPSPLTAAGSMFMGTKSQTSTLYPWIV
ncbi:glideosome-associated protein with multiple-membrane spans GAPM3 [Besnoitia besnoiti]|uniref:Glideosome-associated protein with multiple-membrane spans GAPM3 n=1 Tax=Besnoitia besnoiti TaxID=94643 RepID=A0A2A9MMK0_BESBE|nr:glideosome-associated protein with multiple-membrane spans GAPM3 [Besnoitia besnoiti]PFH37336.1 glideosome-associated protein with multiple-membrane spans GAPM3 [Besnoitia besnoiti]